MRMRSKLIILILICGSFLISWAKDQALLMVSYDFETPNLKTGKRDASNQYMLLTNGMVSRFYSPSKAYIDSLSSTPEGLAKLNEINQSAILANKFDEMLIPKGSIYVLKDTRQGFIKVYDQIGAERLTHTDECDNIYWEISDSQKQILGFDCIKATANYHGRNWSAWFSEEIPLVDGPWKLTGLPGLILEAETDDGLYKLSATGLQQTNRPIGIVYFADTYEIVSRLDFWKAKRAFTDNTLGIINAQHSSDSSTSVTLDEHGATIDVSKPLFLSRNEVDFIETDY